MLISPFFFSSDFYKKIHECGWKSFFCSQVIDFRKSILIFVPWCVVYWRDLAFSTLVRELVRHTNNHTDPVQKILRSWGFH